MWYDDYPVCVELRLSGLKPSFTPRNAAEMLGLEPAQTIVAGEMVAHFHDPHPREKRRRIPAPATSCFFNSRALTDSDDIITHIEAILDYFEPRVSVLRRLAKECRFIDSTIRLRYTQPGETVFELNLLSRLDSLGTSGVGFTMHTMANGGKDYDETENLPTPQDEDRFLFSYTLVLAEGKGPRHGQREYHFEIGGENFLFGVDECSYGVEDGFRQSLIADIHAQRDSIAPLLAAGYAGVFRFSWDYQEDYRWDCITREDLGMMQAVADRVIFAYDWGKRV